MPLPLIAIPVLHSSGLWIASYGGYLAGTLSTTWIGAFILGNSTLLSTLGLASGVGLLGGAVATGSAAAGSALAAVGLGGVAAAVGIAPIATFLGLTLFSWLFVGVAAVIGVGIGIVALFPKVLDWIGIKLTAIGLGKVAKFLGIAPEPTFLGMNATEWAIAGGMTAAAFLLVCLYVGTMRRINRERRKGGLVAITARGIVKELRRHHAAEMKSALSRLAHLNADVTLVDQDRVRIGGRFFSPRQLDYVVNADCSEALVHRRGFGRRPRLLLAIPAVPAIGSDPVGA